MQLITEWHTRVVQFCEDRIMQYDYTHISSLSRIWTWYSQNHTIFSEALGLAPFSNKNCTISATPFSTAQCKGVHLI